jgi:PAS domain S-box-containing protein
MAASGRLSDKANVPGRPRPRRRTLLRAAEEQFSQLFENANDVIIINDREGWVVAANRAAREFGGYSAEDVKRGVHLRQVLPAEEFEAAMIVTQRALDGLPIPEVYERGGVLRDGRRRVLELRSNVLQRRGRPGLLQTIARDITEKKEAAAFQASMLEVAQALLNAQSLEQLGRVICEQASRVLQVEGVYLWLRQGEELVGYAGAGRDAGQFVGLRYPLKGNLLHQLNTLRSATVVNEFQRSQWAEEQWRASGVESVLVLPLRRGAGAIGLLAFVDYQDPNRFTSELGDRATIFGAQIAVAIESALTHEREEEEGRISAALLQVTRALRESLEAEEVVSQIARSARAVLECDWTAVGLWDATRNAFRIVATEGWSSDATQELRLIELTPDSLQLVGRVLAQEVVEIPEPRRLAGLYERWNISSLLVVPMVRSGQVSGALVVGHRVRRGAFSARERRISEGIAAQAAVAVENVRLVEALRRANKLKSEFLGTMSHELRTPLSAILGYTELMRDGAIGPVAGEQSEVLDRMLLNGRALMELINMTLDANRFEAGRVTVETTDFTLEELFGELRNEFAIGAARDGVALRWPERVTVGPLRSDRSKLKLVLRNLIDNALKFTLAGSVTVSIDSDASPDCLRISVRDTGVGIPSDSLSQVFEMFQQVPGAALSARGGVGLGLYLVRRYVDVLGGAVVVRSAVGEGSTFTVDIPRSLEA